APTSDNFETNDFSSKWTSSGAGFGRAGVGDGPLTSFGITDSPGAAPTGSSVHEVTQTVATAVPTGAGARRGIGHRYLKGGTLTYGLVVDGGGKEEFNAGQTAGSAMVSFRTIPITGLGGHSVQIFFRYVAGGFPTAAEGAWLDDLRLECNSPASAP